MTAKEVIESMVRVTKEHPAFFLLVLSLFVGSGISYGNIYLFHFALPITFLVTLYRLRSFNVLLKRIFVPLHLLFGFVFLISLTQNMDFKFIYFYGVAYFTLITFILNSDFIRERWRTLIALIFALVLLDSLIGALEIVSSFRFPISSLSGMNDYFGRDHDFFASYDGCFDLSYSLSSPTGFHWNQNNFAFVLIQFLPFTFWINKSKWKNILRAILLLLILATGSRIGVYITAVLLLTLVLIEYKQKSLWALVPVLTIALLLTDGFYFFPLRSKKIKEVALISQSEFTDRFPDHCYDKPRSEASRVELTKIGIDELKKNPIIGKGAGSMVKVIENRNNQQADGKLITVSPHNFLLEFFVDFGLIMLLPLGWLIYTMYRRMKVLPLKICIPIALYFVALIPATAMISSLVYFLPFYLFLFLIVVFVLKTEDQPWDEKLDNGTVSNELIY